MNEGRHCRLGNCIAVGNCRLDHGMRLIINPAWRQQSSTILLPKPPQKLAVRIAGLLTLPRVRLQLSDVVMTASCTQITNHQGVSLATVALPCLCSCEVHVETGSSGFKNIQFCCHLCFSTHVHLSLDCCLPDTVAHRCSS